MSEQSFSVRAIVIIDEQGSTSIQMQNSDVNVRSWANVARSAGFQVVYQCLGSGYPIELVCVDSAGSYRGMYGRRMCTVHLGSGEIFE